MRALIIGSKGQLGGAFAEYFTRNAWEFDAVDMDRLDITNLDAVLNGLIEFRPGLIINCAAYNLVDKAETDQDKAFAVNAFGPRNIEMALRQLDSYFVHYSTDYVFDGAKGAPYTEADKPNPLNVYGRSKLQGEDFARKAPVSLVLRLSWVYGKGTQNFMHKLKGWAAKPGPLKISDDEISVPTYTGDIVNATMAALKQGLTGTWHLTNGGRASRYDWAKLALKEMGIDKELLPAKMADFSLPARRPGFSAMSNAALSAQLSIKIPEWQDSVSAFLKETRHV